MPRLAFFLFVANLMLFLFACSESADQSAVDGDAIDGDTDGDSYDTEVEPDPEARFRFPDGFLFGAATAGFQVDMGCPSLADEQCVDDQVDWYAYMTSEEMLALNKTHLNGDDPAKVGPGHWELYESDYDLAADKLHNNAFRMSIEWSRIFPLSTEAAETHEELLSLANPDALATYHAMFTAMRERGLEPLVTLHHYTMPLWIHDAVGCTLDIDSCKDKGWLEPVRIVNEISKYARFCAREFGGEVDLWATLNEPFAVLLSGYLMPTEMRSNPPALMLDSDAAKTALAAMLEAHAGMTDAVREADTKDADSDGRAAMVGLIQAMAPALPADPDEPLDVQAAANIFYIWNLLFLDGAALGHEDADLDGLKTLREDWVGRLDYVGLNYKQSMRIEGFENSFVPALSPLLTLNPLSLDLNTVHPRGLYEMLQLVDQRYGLPVIITENNGQALWKNDIETEVDIIVRNLQWMLEAIADGVDLRGYFYWSFMDNIEWNHGMDVRLGLYSVDPTDPAKTRRPRDTVAPYSQICRAKAIETTLRNAHPIDTLQSPTGGVLEAGRFMEME